MDRFDQLRTFVRVADLGSFSRAADDLDRSRALVSQQVAALERRLGARLLNRTTRRVGLTGEGVEYLQRARRILAELEAADEAIMLTRERPQGRLRVDVPTAFGRHLLIPALPAFTRQYPQLVLEVQLNNRVVDLVAEEVDVALRVGAIRQGGLTDSRMRRRAPATHARKSVSAAASSRALVRPIEAVRRSSATSAGIPRYRVRPRSAPKSATAARPQSAFTTSTVRRDARPSRKGTARRSE